MDQVNFLAVLVAAVSAFLLGGLWYSPILFGKIWARDAGVSYDQPKKTHAAIVFAVSFLFSLIAATVFALSLGRNPALNTAVRDGLAIGACWVATSFGINYQFASRTFKLFLIDAGYHVGQFTLYGLILGLWH
ncbi:MAG: DUF1761 domain-containing protein [Pyrinomonadaceae bacterium]|nr:DUF1761 domain-containing protein [Pyrinomonadaceae bacterium]